MKCAFFVQEEVGCIGSGHADMSFFSDCRFVIQCDRKGNGDMVTQINGMKLCSNDFISAIDFRRYGYKPAQGLATDVAALKRNGLEVSCVNLSCGYYEPHTDNEYTILADLASATGLSGTSSVAIRKPARIYRKRKESPSPDIMNCSDRPDIAKRIISVCQKSTDLNLLKQARQAIRTNCNLSTLKTKNMEATVMPATAPVQKQQGLNQVVINKVRRMIEDRQGDVMDTINRLLSEGRIAQDFIAPIGVSQRSKERPVISFKAEGRVQMAMPEGNFNLHGNAISQISEKMGIPAKYLRELSAGDVWQKQLCATILNEHSGWTERTRVLIRAVGMEVRGVLSDSYRR